MNTRAILQSATIVLFSGMIFMLSSCTSTNQMRNGPFDPRIYSNPLTTVVEAAKDAVQEGGFELHESLKVNSNTWYVVFYDEQYMGSNAVQALKTNVEIKKLNNGNTQVQVIRSNRAENFAPDYREDSASEFFEVLTPKLQLVEPKTQSDQEQQQ